MEAAQEKYEVLEHEIQQHEEKMLSLKTHVNQNMVEYSEIEKYRIVIEEQDRCQIRKGINKVNRSLQVTTIICHVL